MLTMSMSKDELARQIAYDFRQLKRWVDLRADSHYNRIWRRGERHLTDSWISHNGNEWTWMIDATSDERASLTFFTTINTDVGRFVFKPQITDTGFIILAFLPHFYKRYRERMKLGPKLKPLALIRRYFRNNATAVQTVKKDGRIEMTTDEGIGLGHFLNWNIRLLRTFITPDMAYDGQIERFADSEAMRKEQCMNKPIYSDEVQRELRMFGLCAADLMAKFKEEHQLNNNNKTE